MVGGWGGVEKCGRRGRKGCPSEGKRRGSRVKPAVRNASETPPGGSGAPFCRSVAPRNHSEAPPSHSEAPRNDSEAPARHSEAPRSRGEGLFCAFVPPRNPSVSQFRDFPPPRNDRTALPSDLMPQFQLAPRAHAPAWARGSLVFRLAFPREPTALLDAATLPRSDA